MDPRSCLQAEGAEKDEEEELILKTRRKLDFEASITFAWPQGSSLPRRCVDRLAVSYTKQSIELATRKLSGLL